MERRKPRNRTRVSTVSIRVQQGTPGSSQCTWARTRNNITQNALGGEIAQCSEHLKSQHSYRKSGGTDRRVPASAQPVCPEKQTGERAFSRQKVRTGSRGCPLTSIPMPRHGNSHIHVRFSTLIPPEPREGTAALLTFRFLDLQLPELGTDQFLLCQTRQVVAICYSSLGR